MPLTPQETRIFQEAAFALRAHKMIVDTAQADKVSLNGDFDRLQSQLLGGVEMFRDAMEATLRRHDGSVSPEEFHDKFADILAVD